MNSELIEDKTKKSNSSIYDWVKQTDAQIALKGEKEKEAAILKKERSIKFLEHINKKRQTRQTIIEESKSKIQSK